jgi:hypothetical protein
MNIVYNIPDFGEQLDASALVQGCRLQNPLVVLAVLLGNSLENRKTLTNVKIRKTLFKPTHF